MFYRGSNYLISRIFFFGYCRLINLCRFYSITFRSNAFIMNYFLCLNKKKTLEAIKNNSLVSRVMRFNAKIKFLTTQWLFFIHSLAIK